MSCSRHAAFNGLMSRSPLANRFSKYVPGPQNWYPEICNSIRNAFIAWFKKPHPFVVVDICLWQFLINGVGQYAIDGRVNYNVLSTDDVAESVFICSGNLSQLIYVILKCKHCSSFRCQLKWLCIPFQFIIKSISWSSSIIDNISLSLWLAWRESSSNRTIQ